MSADINEQYLLWLYDSVRRIRIQCRILLDPARYGKIGKLINTGSRHFTGNAAGNILFRRLSGTDIAKRLFNRPFRNITNTTNAVDLPFAFDHAGSLICQSSIRKGKLRVLF